MCEADPPRRADCAACRFDRDVYDICVHPEPEHAGQLYDRFRVLVDEHLESQREVQPHALF
jgi:hypothetical protein